MKCIECRRANKLENMSLCGACALIKAQKENFSEEVEQEIYDSMRGFSDRQISSILNRVKEYEEAK